MKVFDLEKYVSDNGEYVKEYAYSYSEYKIDNEYKIKLTYYNVFRQLDFMINDMSIHKINTTYELDEVEKLERVLKNCKDIVEVMDYYAVKYIREKRIEAEEEKRIDKFMLKGE